jgi:hypothetical protein
VRCTFKTRISHHCYKYCGALHLQNADISPLLQILRCAAPSKRGHITIATNIAVRSPSKRGYLTIATNIAVRCTFYEKTLNF